MVYFQGRFQSILTSPSCPVTVDAIKCPEPLCTLEVYLLCRSVAHFVSRHYPAFIAPTDSCVNPKSSRHLGMTSVAGLCRLLSASAGSRTFPALSLRIFLYVLKSLPRLLLWCAYPFLPTEQRPSRSLEPVGA